MLKKISKRYLKIHGDAVFSSRQLGKVMLKISSLESKISKVKKLVEDKLARGQSADEFEEIGEADGFKIYVTAGKTIGESVQSFHENQRDVFILILEGEVEFTFKSGDRATAKSGEYFVLPQYLKHICNFKRLTVTLEGVYEEGL
jgi:quercetin dioxygenase-like cupin family protein